MKRLSTLFIILYIVVIVPAFLISLFVKLECSFKNTYYLYISDDNKDEIMNLLEENDISTDSELKYVVADTGLGDWILHIGYKDGTTFPWTMGDSGSDLESYIIQNGIVGGKVGEVSGIVLGIATFLLILGTVHLLTNSENRRTLEY